jgi:hypothetical protein
VSCIAFCFDAASAAAEAAFFSTFDKPRFGPLAIVFSALSAGVLAWFTIRSNRSMARKQATLALIERNKSTEYYQALSIAFAEIRSDRENGFEQLKTPSNPQIKEQRRKVLEYLNHYELIAVGIAQGALDDSLYKAYRRTTLVRDWRAVEGFVQHLRDNTPESHAPKAFTTFEALAIKWETEAERKSRKEKA